MSALRLSKVVDAVYRALVVAQDLSDEMHTESGRTADVVELTELELKKIENRLLDEIAVLRRSERLEAEGPA